MAFDSLTRYLRGRGVQARMVKPGVAVWPSTAGGKISVALLRMDVCRPVSDERGNSPAMTESGC